MLIVFSAIKGKLQWWQTGNQNIHTVIIIYYCLLFINVFISLILFIYQCFTKEFSKPQGARVLGGFLNESVIEGNITESKKIQCVFFGTPIPKVTWNTHISETKVRNVVHVNNGTVVSVLDVSNLKWEDHGIFECHGKNNHGEASVKGRLIVHCK